MYPSALFFHSNKMIHKNTNKAYFVCFYKIMDHNKYITL